MNVLNNFAYIFFFENYLLKKRIMSFLVPFYGVCTTLGYQELWIIMINDIRKKINMIRVIPVDLYSLVFLRVLGFKTSCLATARDNQL